MNNSGKLNIIFEDENLIVLNKQSGILTIPDRYNPAYPSLYSILKKEYGKIFIIHRLDKDTSGAVMFAKDAETHRAMSMAFENNLVLRRYEVVIEGILPRDEMEIDIPLRPSRKKVGITVPSAKGKPSLTKVKVIEKYRSTTLVECTLETGRHHQIRVHMQTIGYPLLVDELYGNHTEFFVSSVKKRYNIKKGTKEFPLISRLTMHSRELAFVHPSNNEKVSFIAEYPKDFSSLLNVLRKYSKK